MAEAEKVKLESMDIAEEKREQLKSLFPEAFTEGNIDFEQLKRALGQWVEPGKERFGLNWPGKAECMKIIQQPSVATLKPARDESMNFDGTENLFIEGDNLEVLKLLQKSYFGKVKMIYIDPPYNTGHEFIYPDKFAETLDTYLEYTGQKDANGHKFSTNAETNGRYHSRWLNMMYPRLYLARNLLREDGFIVVSIDDNEATNLKHLLDEVFGEENHLAVLCWDRNRKNDAKFFSVGHEYMFIYAKDKQHLIDNEIILREPKQGIEQAESLFRRLRKKHADNWDAIEEEWRTYFRNLPNSDPAKKLGRYSKVGPDGPFRDDGNISWPGGGGPKYEVIHPETGKPCKVPDGGWRYSKSERFWEEVKNGKVVFGPDETTLPRQCRYLFDGEGQVMPSVFYSYAQTAAMEFNELMGPRIFENPKNWRDLERLVNYLTKDDDIVLDFFAGSASTAHAVLSSNSKESTNKKFILVQLPEKCTDSNDALKAGYKTIADVSKERIRRAAKKIEEEQNGQLDFNGGEKPDLGFKVFKLSRSNFKVWEGDVEKIENLEQQLFDHVDHIDGASKPESILYELLLKSGFPLTTRVETIQLAGKDVFSVEDGALLICLDKELTQEVIDAIADANPCQVICLDDGFKGNDQLKANAVQTFKARAQEEESEIVFRTV